MVKKIKEKLLSRLNGLDTSKKKAVKERIFSFSRKSADKVMRALSTSLDGISDAQVKASRERHGINRISFGKKKSLIKRIFEAFINPFTAILAVLAGVSLVTDIILAEPGEGNPLTVIIIATMVMISGLLRFIQETRSGNAAARLSEMVKTTATVVRKGCAKIELPIEDVTVGDIIFLSAGDMIPADVRVVTAKDLFISQSTLTGESDPQEKTAGETEKEYDNAADCPNIAFMGSNVISGSSICVVIAVGNETLFGQMSKDISAQREETSFEKGVNSVSWVLIRFMLVMVPVVLFINGFTKGDWMEALLFAISVAVGLTPEMLPMIVTTCLAKGAVSMSKEKTIIKNLNSMQNFGAMDILCTDKTGTLTQDKVVLIYHMDVSGRENYRVLRHAYLNSYFQTGLKNLMDIAVIEKTEKEAGQELGLWKIASHYKKVDEIPFDFTRRRMSVVVTENNEKTQMITKGAVEEMLKICKYVEYNGQITELSDNLRQEIAVTVDMLNDNGMRVIALAEKTNQSLAKSFSVADESDMTLMGYLAFLDPPKETTEIAIKALKEYGVGVKILTGDNDRVTHCICRQVGIDASNLLLGSDIEKMPDSELKSKIEKINVFAKLTPDQKARIVTLLKANGHVVGFMGDGINDAAAMKASDIGISVDTAVDIAKESADIILLEKDLMVLKKGIILGRKTYGNMIKYIKMTASSNFGNVFSVLCASAFLPFLPMAAIHLILLNLIYDISCTALPWDNVDEEFLKVPRNWSASSIAKFMAWIGPTSSVFDITTYLLMYFVICPAMCGGLLFSQITDPAMQAYYIALFQAGWFVESMWTQTMVIHMIRTPKIPFLQSRASFPVVVLTFTGIAALTIIPFTAFGAKIGLAPLPPEFFGWLALTVLLYMMLVTVVKKIYIKKYGELL